MSDWYFKVLFDGECPFCRLEAHWLSYLNQRGKLVLEDIAAPDFDAARYGRTFAELMGSLHGVHADGRLTTGMETFRQAYRALGLGWLLAPTAWPVLRPVFDFYYTLFARTRLRFGRVVAGGCANGRCALPWTRPGR